MYVKDRSGFQLTKNIFHKLYNLTINHNKYYVIYNSKM